MKNKDRFMGLFKRKSKDRFKPAKPAAINHMCCPECADSKYPCVKMEKQIKKSASTEG